MRVYVLLFNAGTENEGIHTIQMGDRNKVLMFEDEDDATRFGVLLEAQDFPTAKVEALDEEEIKEFCQSVDYDWELVASGELAIPPEHNVDETDWQVEAEKQVEVESNLGSPELDDIRKRLEGLL
ncbi:conserved hypothetical protein [Planktothrix serta PCC 8927]|uniref:DUF3110 domain-containing protein n=1 Tax=Planktothrix serta PCC 8927 TaxID=671068 RepID=A0A7Z9BVZ3_9CYAN|nr:DUF3110 domain-containing protein [Planktothrix serta]VXD22471.1 conserved hypothetical protein [Planktothrix serta PCC 8927]VXD25552.1 conserved hypothetical protein [Planktothrix serta PCC 8927]